MIHVENESIAQYVSSVVMIGIGQFLGLLQFVTLCVLCYNVGATSAESIDRCFLARDNPALNCLARNQ